MSAKVQTQIKAQSTSAPAFASAQTNLLQKKGTSKIERDDRLGIQTKVLVNEPGDVYEQEADLIADQVMATSVHWGVTVAPPPIQRFGHDFSRVRVHSDGAADAALTLRTKPNKKAPPKKQKPNIPMICGRPSRKVPGNSIIKVNIDVGANTLSIEWKDPKKIPPGGVGTHRISPGAGKCCVDCDDKKVSQTSGSLCTPKGGVWPVDFTGCVLSGHPTAKNPTYFQRGGIAIHSGNTSSPPQSHGCTRTSVEISELIHDNVVPEQTQIASSGTWAGKNCYLKEASTSLSNRKDVCDGNKLKSKKKDKKVKKKLKQNNKPNAPEGTPKEQTPKPEQPSMPIAKALPMESDELVKVEELEPDIEERPEMMADGPGPNNESLSHESLGEVLIADLGIIKETGEGDDMEDETQAEALIKSGALQAKLRIGQPNDIFEQEADMVAEQVMMPDFSSNEKDKRLQTKEAIGKTLEVSSHIEANIKALKVGGIPLPESTRAFFEPRFVYDFSRVRVHSGSAAEQSAREVNANAYTMGHNIVFGAGRFAPETQEGRRLIAHELTHVVQQSGIAGHFGNATTIHRVPQESALNEAHKSGKTLPKQNLKKMDVQTLSIKPSGDRRAWYVDQLGAFENQLKESANIHVVPVQLLATVILNELADIDWKDTLQSDLFVTKGSLGIAQIQIDTAIRDNLFPDLSEAEGKKAYDEMVGSLPPNSSRLIARMMQTKDKEKRLAVNKRLQIPQHAIDAAGREIRLLLNQMIAHRTSSWQTTFGFTHSGIAIPLSAQAIYNDVAGASQREKELNLSNMITGAYNSPNIINATDSSENVFPNANIHGENSRMIAGDLFDFGLFRP